MKPTTLQPAADGRAPVPGSAAAACAHERPLPGTVIARDPPSAFPLKQCQHLLKQRLTRSVLDTFCELTGLRLHARWHRPVAEWQPGGFSIVCPKPRQHLAGKLPERCQRCLRKRWPCVWNSRQTEKRFAGLCGSMNYSAWVKVLDRRTVTLTVQQPGPASRDGKQAFLRAVHLARIVLHDLRATLEASRAFDEPRPVRVERASCLHQRPKEPLRGAGETPALRCLSGNGDEGCPWTRQGEPAPCHLPPGNSHREQLVGRMLDYIHQHYGQPIQLANLATALNMNATYVSCLFSSTLGVTFRHYLEQLRLGRAKDLLRDPIMRVSEVAYAVGYSGPNHFRNVFTNRVGIPPRPGERLPRLPATDRTPGMESSGRVPAPIPKNRVLFQRTRRCGPSAGRGGIKPSLNRLGWPGDGLTQRRRPVLQSQPLPALRQPVIARPT